MISTHGLVRSTYRAFQSPPWCSCLLPSRPPLHGKGEGGRAACPSAEALGFVPTQEIVQVHHWRNVAPAPSLRSHPSTNFDHSSTIEVTVLQTSNLQIISKTTLYSSDDNVMTGFKKIYFYFLALKTNPLISKALQSQVSRAGNTNVFPLH